MRLRKTVARKTRKILHRLNNSGRGVTEIIVAMMACDFMVCGTHVYSQKIKTQRTTVIKRQIQQAQDDGDVIHPKVSGKVKNDFAHKFARLNESLPQKDRVTPSLLIAQAGLESDWGDSPLYQKANNPFGVKGDYHGNYMNYYTNEDDSNDNGHIEMADFRQYPSLIDAIRDHNRLLKKQFLKGSGRDYVSQARAIQDNGYATDPNYARKLMTYIQKNNLTKFD